MKTFSKIVAILMVVAMLAAVFTACGDDKKESNLKDERIIGTWKQTDEIDGNWTWVFNEDGTCSLTGETTGFQSSGTYKNEGDDYGKLRIKLDDWSEEALFTYAVTEKVLDLEGINASYYLIKQ